MDPATAAVTGTAAAAAYGVETAAEAGAAAYFVAQPTLPLKARLEHVSCVDEDKSEQLRRSSHSLTVVGDTAYCFGGEIEPRKPVGNEVEVLKFVGEDGDNGTGVVGKGGKRVKVERVEARAATEEDGGNGDKGAVPAARVGHTAVAARNRIFVFGGRGGADMTALPEGGRLWVFDPARSHWLFLDPPPGTESPCARSYHASTASDDGNAVFIHAGCASDGSRLSDTWAFFLDEGKWTRLANAPGQARGGPSLTYAQGRLWRFGGFDGTDELGGALDYLDVPTPTKSIDQATTPDAVHNHVHIAGWKSLPFTIPTKDNSPTASSNLDTTPANRSLAALHAISAGAHGRQYLVLALGEASASATGHVGAGTFHHDLWAYQLPAASMFSAAAVKDAIREKAVPALGLAGATTSTTAAAASEGSNTSTTTQGLGMSGRGMWAKVEITGMEVSPAEGAREKGTTGGGRWTGRGWFASDRTGKSQVMIWGGMDATSERLGDGWILVVE